MTEIDKNIIPIFPLPTVLFPNSSLRLHIFEERYKKMVIDCLTLNCNFGICLISENKLSYTGCTAKITKIDNCATEGEMYIIVMGWDRFFIKKLIDSDIYLKAEIEYKKDINEPIDEKISLEVLNLYNELHKVIFKTTIDVNRFLETIPILSFKLSEKIGMIPEERQELLECNSENKRLQLLSKYLKDILPKIKDYSIIQEIINNNGYL